MAKKKYTEEEARLRKNERQREYAKRTKYAAQNKHLKEHSKSLSIRLFHPQDDDILQKLDNVPNKAGYVKGLIRKDIRK